MDGLHPMRAPTQATDRNFRALLGLFCFVAACSEPSAPVQPWRANSAALELLGEDAEARAGLERDLQALFGTAEAPLWPGEALGRAELAASTDGERRLARLREANAVRHARSLAAIDDFDWDEVRAREPSLQSAWRLLRDEAALSSLAAEDLRARAKELFLDWYPTLEDSARLYAAECFHCHGAEGGGDGPTAHFLKPRPRDVRLGVYKWTALASPARPRRDDLLRTLKEGVNGTSMPSFARLSETQLEGLVDYIRLLSVRGEVELRMAATFESDGEWEDEAARGELDAVLSRWDEARDKVLAYDGPVPPATSESIARGEALYNDATKGNCASCHGVDGRGDGPAAWKIGPDGARAPAYLDAWGDPILPRNLRLGIWRGGSRPIDLWRRIANGIPGGPMPALREAEDKDGARVVSDEEIWSLVHYVQSLERLGSP